MQLNINLGNQQPRVGGFAGPSPMGNFGGNPMMQMMQIMMQMMMTLMNGMMGGQMGQHPMGMGNPNFGGGGQMPGGCGCGGGSPLGNFLGGGGMPSYGGGGGMPNYGGGAPQYNNGQFGGANGPAFSPGTMAGATPTGQRILQSIQNSPVPPRCRPGYCYRGVKHHLRQVGVNLTGGSAYMAADQLAGRPDRFREVRVGRDQLRQLPPGAVVVWNRSQGKPHGHISIATGDGREASDKLRNQITGRNATYRVFIPR